MKEISQDPINLNHNKVKNASNAILIKRATENMTNDERENFN